MQNLKSHTIHWLKQHLNFLIFGIALLSQLVQGGVFFSLENTTDRNQQVLATKLWYEGHGISVQSSHPEVLGEVVYVPLKGWPPGYSFLLLPAYLVVQDWVCAALLLHLLGILLLFGATHLLLRCFTPYLHQYTYPAFFSFWAISFTPFHYLLTTDIWALALFQLGLFLLLDCIRRIQLGGERDVSWIWLGLAATLASMAVYIRYAYYPLLLIQPLLLIALGILHARYWWRVLIGQIGITVMFIVPLWFGQQLHTGSATYLADSVGEGQMFYLEHLLNFDAFPIKAFCYISADAIIRKAGLSSAMVIGGIRGGFFLLSLALIILMVYIGFRHLRKFWHSPQQTSIYSLWYLAALGIMGLNVGLLLYLSLRHPMQVFEDGQSWTYLAESRYYAPTLLFIQMVVFTVLFQWKSRFYQYFLLLMCGLMGYTALHGVYRNAEWVLGWDYRDTIWSEENQGLIHRYQAAVAKVGEAPEIPLLYFYSANAYEENRANVLGWGGAIPLANPQPHHFTPKTHKALNIWMEYSNWKKWRKELNLDIASKEIRPIAVGEELLIQVEIRPSSYKSD